VAVLHAVDDVWVKSFNTRDADTMAAQYDEHAVLLPPGAPAARGQTAIRAFFANMMPEATKDGLEFTLGSKPAGGALVLTIEDRNGRRSEDEYVGVTARRPKVIDRLGRIRTRRQGSPR
jgi:ketosteroid isomerase-like protein